MPSVALMLGSLLVSTGFALGVYAQMPAHATPVRQIPRPSLPRQVTPLTTVPAPDVFIRTAAWTLQLKPSNVIPRAVPGYGTVRIIQNEAVIQDDGSVTVPFEVADAQKGVFPSVSMTDGPDAAALHTSIMFDQRASKDEVQKGMLHLQMTDKAAPGEYTFQISAGSNQTADTFTLHLD